MWKKYVDVYVIKLLGDMLHSSISPIVFVRILFISLFP